MKLISTFLCLDAANAASVTCMQSDADDSPIEMTATVTNSEIKHDLTADSDWSCSGAGDDATCTRSWGADAFTGAGETTFDATHLILTKTVAANCQQTNVDGVDVCIQEGHSLEFKCKYPLGETTVTGTFDVAGHDTVAQEEGFGTLKYTLTVVNPNVDIGDTVNVEVEAVNKGLVYHHLQDCTVSKSGQDVSILNWDGTNNNLETVCPNVLGAAIGVSNHQDKTSFSWTAFKWSTSTQAPDDEETQTITCTISLSENAPTVNTPSCPSDGTGDESGSEDSEIKYIKQVNYMCDSAYSDIIDHDTDIPDVEDCKTKCDNDQTCITFSHHSSLGGCTLYSSCESDFMYYYDGTDTHTKVVGSEENEYTKHENKLCHQNHFDLIDSDYGFHDFDDCKLKCDYDENCIFFNYDMAANMCMTYSRCDLFMDFDEQSVHEKVVDSEGN